MLQCRFQQCLRPVKSLILKGCSKTGTFGHWSNYISLGEKIQKYFIYEADLLIQNGQNFVSISKMQENFQKMFFVFQTIALQPVAGTSLIYDENICDLQSTCYQTVLRFQIWLRETFSYSISPRFIGNWDKSAAV